MNHGMVLAALPNREEEGISMKEIAQAIGPIPIGSELKGGLLDH